MQFHFNEVLAPALLDMLQEMQDVVCVSMDVVRTCLPEAEPDQALMYLESPALVCGVTDGVLDSAFGAKKAALTVDRSRSKAASVQHTRRGRRGVYAVIYVARWCQCVQPDPLGDGIYSKEEAIAEAARCIQCHCDECIKACPYLRHYNKFPRLLTREIYNNVSIIMGDHVMNKPINACSLCGQCKVVCPNGYDMAEVCHLARQNMVETGKRPLAPHEFALMDMMFSNNEAFLAQFTGGF